MKRKVFFLLQYLLFANAIFAQQKTLGFYLSQAKANAPGLAELHNHISSLGLDSGKLKASYGPQVAASANLLYAPVIRGWGYDNAITNGQNIMGVITVSKEIIGKNNLQTRLDNFAIQQRILDNQATLSQKSLEQAVTQQYISCYGNLQELELAKEIDEFLQKEDVVLKQLTQSAVFKQTDYLTFKVALQQQHLVVQQSRAQYMNGIGTLNYICGIEDTSWIDLARPVIEDSMLPPFEQTDYYRAALLDSIKNANDAKIINLDYKPKVNVFADGGYQSSLERQPYKNFGVSVGLNLRLPLYDGKQRKTALLQNKLLEDSRKKYTDFYRSQFNQQALQLTQQVEQYKSLVAASGEQLLYAKTLVEANHKQLTTGDVHITDYLLSVNNYLNLRSGIIQNEVTLFLLLNQLHNIILK